MESAFSRKPSSFHNTGKMVITRRQKWSACRRLRDVKQYYPEQALCRAEEGLNYGTKRFTNRYSQKLSRRYYLYRHWLMKPASFITLAVHLTGWHHAGSGNNFAIRVYRGFAESYFMGAGRCGVPGADLCPANHILDRL